MDLFADFLCTYSSARSLRSACHLSRQRRAPRLIRPATSAFVASRPLACAIAIPRSTTSLNGVSEFCALAGGTSMMSKRFLYSSISGSLSPSKYAGGMPNLLGLPILDGSASVRSLYALIMVWPFCVTPLVAEVPRSSRDDAVLRHQPPRSGRRAARAQSTMSAQIIHIFTLRTAQIAPRRAQVRFHNGQLCAWPFTNKNSLPPSDF